MRVKVTSVFCEIGDNVSVEAPLGTCFLEPVLSSGRLLLCGLTPLNEYGSEDDLMVSYSVTTMGVGDKSVAEEDDYIGVVMRGSSPLLVFVRRA
jgi:hypothetical protein